MKPFIHLHLHSEFSLLDSTLRIPQMVKKALDFNMPAVALTDHGSILGAVSFYKEAVKNEIKPIIGTELYIAPESRFSKPDKRGDAAEAGINYFHLIVLVKNDQGYKNLSELITASFLEGFYRKPRIDKEILKKYSEGLVVLSSCIHGEIPYLLLKNQPEKAREAAVWFRDVFKDDFFIEIQNHQIGEQLTALPLLIGLAKELSIPLVASNDVHYLNRDDADAREILICLQTNEVMSNAERPMKKETDQMYFKSMEDMSELFANIEESISNTMEIAARCNFDFKLRKYYLPEFTVPGKFSVDDYFELICREGFERIKHHYLEKRKKLKNPPERYQERLDHEMEKIREMGFPGYFLIVWDIVRFAREKAIPVGPGRGSVVGSLVAFVMGITQIDPLEYDLIFERFLNPARKTLPDIDIDFDGERRDEIIDYIRSKYGQDNVAQIVTFGKMKAKLAVRDIGRVMEIPLHYVNKLAKIIPDGPKVLLKDEIDNNPDLQREIKQHPETADLMNHALKLEGNIRHTSMHAAGVVIAPKKLTEFMPLYRTKDEITTHFEKEEVEDIGLLKMDILGLKTLTIMKNILEDVKKIEGIGIDLENLDLTDHKTFKLFQKGDTDGIFQFESSGMKDLLKRVKPNRIDELIVLNGLYRPGPLEAGMVDSYVNRKQGKEKVIYIFPEMEEILKDTYGVIVFQEQVMQISQKIAGYTMSEADDLRRIMGKKKKEEMAEQEKEFIDRAAKRGHKKDKTKELFFQIDKFGGYGFNKSHSTAYAYLAFQTAYLKAHFPVYFMSAHLSSEAEKTSTSSKIIQYVSESKKMGISILPPDINRSQENFRVESPNAVRFGLIGLKNVGSAAIKTILLARQQSGDFTDFSDFILRSDLSKVNKSVLESLIKAGAFDSFGMKRRSLLESVEDVIRQAGLIEKRRLASQKNLFASQEVPLISIPEKNLKLEEWSENEIIQKEKEIAGIYISVNPLEKFSREITRVSNTSVLAILNKEFKSDMVKLGGVVSEVIARKSKRGDAYGELYFEDLTGRLKLLVFKDKWENCRETLKLDTPYYMEGRLVDSEESSIYLEELSEIEQVLKKKARKVVITVDYKLIGDAFNEKLKQKIERNSDTVPYLIVIRRDDGSRAVINSEEGRGLKATVAMKKEIEKLTGENTVEILF